MKLIPFAPCLALLLLLSQVFPAGIEEKGCNLDLMNAFRLEGRKSPELNKPIDICGNVRDNCCTLADQMMIVKFWKQYSSPLLAFRINKIVDYYRTIFSFHHYFYGLKIETLPTHLQREGTIRYQKTTCVNEFEFLPGFWESDWVHVSEPKGKGRKSKGRHLSDAQDQLDFVAQVSFVPEGEAGTVPLPVPRALSDKASSHVEIPEEEMKKMQKIQTLKLRFQTTIHNSLERVTRIISRRLNQIEKMKQKLQDRLNLVNHELKFGGSDPRLLAGHGGHSDDQPKTLFNYKNFQDFYKGKEVAKPGKTLLEEEKADLEKTIDALDYTAKKILKYQNKALLKRLKIDFDNDKFAKFLEDVQSSKLPVLPDSKSLNRRRSMPPNFPIELPKTTCVKTRNTIYRRAYYINQAKYRYCDNVLWAVKKIHLADFVAYLPDVQQSLNRMGSLRRGLYCAICDFSTQQFIDFQNKVVYYNQDFCEAYIWEFAEYFRWKDILFVEYLQHLFQTISCFDSDGHARSFPFRTLVDHQFQKAFFYRRCFDAINTEDWFKYCHFICREFKYDTLSQMIEGDIAFLKEVTSRLVSFLRKQNVSLKRLDLSKLDAVAKVDLLAGHHVKKVGEDIDEMIQTEFENQMKTRRTRRSGTSQTRTKKEDPDRFVEEPDDPPKPLPSSKKGKTPGNEGRVLEEKPAETPLSRAAVPKERQLRVTQVDRPQLARAGLPTQPERRLAGNDFSPQAIYHTRINIGQINRLSVYFYKDTRGLNPILIDGLVNFDFDTDEYLKTYAIKNSAEPITSGVMKAVLTSIPNEKPFSLGIVTPLPLRTGHAYSAVEEFHTYQEKMKEGTNPLRNFVFRERARAAELPPGLATDVENTNQSDGIPEMDYILS